MGYTTVGSTCFFVSMSGLGCAVFFSRVKVEIRDFNSSAMSANDCAEAVTSSTWALSSSVEALTSSTAAEFSSLTLAMFSMVIFVRLGVKNREKLPGFKKKTSRIFREVKVEEVWLACLCLFCGKPLRRIVCPQCVVSLNL